MNCPLTKGIFSWCHFYEIPLFLVRVQVFGGGRCSQQRFLSILHPRSAGCRSGPDLPHQWGNTLLKNLDPKQHPHCQPLQTICFEWSLQGTLRLFKISWKTLLCFSCDSDRKEPMEGTHPKPFPILNCAMLLYTGYFKKMDPFQSNFNLKSGPLCWNTRYINENHGCLDQPQGCCDRKGAVSQDSLWNKDQKEGEFLFPESSC